MSYSFTGTSRTVGGARTAGVYGGNYAGATSFAQPSSGATSFAQPSFQTRSTGTVMSSGARAYTGAPVTTAPLRSAGAYTGATNFTSAPTVSSYPTASIGTYGATRNGTYGASTALPATTRPATIGTSRIATQPQSYLGAAPVQTFGAPTVYAGSTQVYSGNTIVGGQIGATYLGGTAVTTASANLLSQGNVVSERVVSMQEAYNSGIVRSEVGGQPVYTEAVQYVEQVQPVYAETITAQGQVEFVQVAEQAQFVQQEVIQTMVEGQPVEEVVQGQEQPGAPRVVIVCTSADQMGDHPTGAWSEEITGPYYVFREAGCEVYIASVAGGLVPIDQASLAEGTYTENDRRFQEEGGLQLLENSIPMGNIQAEDIDCVWLAGGHGTCMDFEAALAQFVTDAVAYGRPVGAVCHGVIGLLSAINQDGTPLLQGRQVTGFSNAEEDMVGLSDKVPFLVQARMEEVGAAYSCGEPWSDYALADGPIITGQNPQSSVRAAQLCIQAMMPPQ